MLFSKEVPKEDGVYWATHLWAYTAPNVFSHKFAPFLVKVVHFSYDNSVSVIDAYSGNSSYSPDAMMFGSKVEVPIVDNSMTRVSTKLNTKFVLE